MGGRRGGKDNNFMIEEWKEIKGYKGKYFISSLGNVKSFIRQKSGKLLKNNSNNKGYMLIDLSKSGKSKTYLIHRLVLSTFLYSSNLQVNHIDGNKANNNINNLEYVDNRENKNHCLVNSGKKYRGVFKNNKKFAAKTEIDNKPVYIGTFNTEEEAHEAYKCFCKKLGSVKYI